MKGYIEKHILEEAVIETKKAFNEWTSLFDLAKDTERRDLLLEAAYFTLQWDVLEREVRLNFEEENATNLIYFMTAMLATPHPEILDPDKGEAVDVKVSRTFKEAIYLLLIRDWVSLPRVFSEGHIYHASIAHFWVEFEEMFDILQELRTKKPGDPRNAPYIGKFKDDITFMSMICRQRVPNPAEGLFNAKKLLGQRNYLSYLQQIRMRDLLDPVRQYENPKRFNVFNESVHNAVMYAKVERYFGIYSSIQAFTPSLDQLLDEEAFNTQTDEFYYYNELIKFWAVDENAKEPPERVVARLRSEGFNKDLKSGLCTSLMEGYIEKGMLDKANEQGLEGLRLNEEKLEAVGHLVFTLQTAVRCHPEH